MMLAGVALVLAQAAAPAEQLDGVWQNPDASVTIAIAPCGEFRCGTVQAASAEAQADARKGVAQLIGTQLLTELKPLPDGRWAGRLFIPDKNLRARATLALAAPDRLKVSGCKLVLCKSQTWTRASDQPPAAQ